MSRSSPRVKPAAVTVLLVALVASLIAGSCSKGSDAAATGTAPSASSSSSTSPARPAAVTASSSPTDIGATAPPLPSAGCGRKGLLPELGVVVDVPLAGAGSTGKGSRLVPTSYRDEPTALVLDLHGYSEPYGFQPKLSGLPDTAEREGFVYLAPQVDTSSTPYWNALPQPAERDDLGFLRAVIADTEEQLCIDTGRVYVAGMSNGAFMSSLIACRLADEVTAIAPVAGFRFPTDCRPSRPVPVIAFHGTGDPIVPYEGGEPGPATLGLPFDDTALRVFEGIEFESLSTVAAKWATLEGCATPPSEQQFTATTTFLAYDGCEGGSAVELYSVAGGGHSWPGTPFGKAIESMVGPTTDEIIANDLMWSFFSKYALPR